MPFTNEISLLNSKFMALLIGKPGTGKTLAGASFSEAGPMEFMDFDGRMKPVRLHYPKAQIHYTEFNTKNVEEFAYRYIPGLLSRCDFKTVQLAGITSLSNVLVTYQLRVRQGSNEIGKKNKGGIVVPGWDEYSGEASIISQVLDALRALPCNVIVEAHPIQRVDMATSTKYTSIVSFGPKVESVIPAYFDEIWYFTTERSIDGQLLYIVNTRPTAEFPLAKTSLPLPHRFTLTGSEGQVLSLYELIQNCLNEYGEMEDQENMK
jgi:hypothetical protein